MGRRFQSAVILCRQTVYGTGGSISRSCAPEQRDTLITGPLWFYAGKTGADAEPEWTIHRDQAARVSPEDAAAMILVGGGELVYGSFAYWTEPASRHARRRVSASTRARSK